MPVAGKKKGGVSDGRKSEGVRSDVLPTSLVWLLKNTAVKTSDKNVMNTRNSILRNPTDKSVS